MPSLTAVLEAGASALVVLLVVFGMTGIRPVPFLDDPAEVAGAAWYGGAVSKAIDLTWASAAATCLFVAAAWHDRRPETARFFRDLGLLTLLFLLGDAYQLHERVSYQYLGSELPMISLNLTATVLVALRHGRHVLSHPDGSILMCSLAFLGASLLLDVVGLDVRGRLAAEEGLKLLGVLGWALFTMQAGLRIAREGHTRNKVPAGEPAQPRPRTWMGSM